MTNREAQQRSVKESSGKSSSLKRRLLWKLLALSTIMAIFASIILWQSFEVSSRTSCYFPQRVTVNPANNDIAVSLFNGTIRIFDSANYSTKKELTLFTGPVIFLNYNLSGDKLAIFGADGETKILQVPGYDVILSKKWKKLKSSYFDICLSNDFEYLAIADDKTVKLYNARNGKLLWRYRPNQQENIDFVAINHNPDLAVIASGGDIYVFDLASNRKFQVLQGERYVNTDYMLFSPDGRILLVKSFTKIYWVDMDSGKLVENIYIPGEYEYTYGGMAYEWGKNRLFLCNRRMRSVDVYDGKTFKKVSSIYIINSRFQRFLFRIANLFDF